MRRGGGDGHLENIGVREERRIFHNLRERERE
jgi:hypothetical protein